ncbi:MAG: hypothetical protein CM1200mP14_18890 [Gammaproteobacteria bacterium]|nr:MAG: hypothetical protein CM1200mP14_18890 [Gammaproteobacteria bacterium]
MQGGPVRKSCYLFPPGADHSLIREEHQVDYHRRILDWFGHYFKGVNQQQFGLPRVKIGLSAAKESVTSLSLLPPLENPPHAHFLSSRMRKAI